MPLTNSVLEQGEIKEQGVPPLSFLKRFKKRIDHFRNLLWHTRVVLQGLYHFRRTGITPPQVHHHLIGLFRLSKGIANDVLHWAITRQRPKIKLSNSHGVLGNLSSAHVKALAADIQKKGYHVFENRLPENLVAELEKLARTSQCTLFPPSQAIEGLYTYSSTIPKAPIYRLQEKDLVESALIQELMADNSLLSVVQEYLGCAPLLDSVSMWWSTCFSKTPSADGAQLYHYDMDWLKWMKYFIYITDVTPKTGAHCYIEGSHRPLFLSNALYANHYERLPDATMLKHFPQSVIKELCGKKGTIIAADTRGFHKGKHLIEGERLILELEFCGSLFGRAYDLCPIQEIKSAALKQSVVRYSALYSPRYVK